MSTQFQLATQGTPDVDSLEEPISSVFTASGVVPVSKVGLSTFSGQNDPPLAGRVPFTVAALLNGFSGLVELSGIPSGEDTPPVLKNLQRLPDNFLMAELRPALSTQRGREVLKDEYFRLRKLAEASPSENNFAFNNTMRISLMLAFNVLDLAVEKGPFGDLRAFSYCVESVPVIRQ